MAWPKVGDKVYDRCTETVATIVKSTGVDVDGVICRMFELDGVPTTPNYPTPWRNSYEISTARWFLKK